MFHRLQTERLRQQREGEDRLEQQAARYEDRLIELHSVIAELHKKLDRYQISVIRSVLDSLTVVHCDITKQLALS